MWQVSLRPVDILLQASAKATTRLKEQLWPWWVCTMTSFNLEGGKKTTFATAVNSRTLKLSFGVPWVGPGCQGQLCSNMDVSVFPCMAMPCSGVSIHELVYICQCHGEECTNWSSPASSFYLHPANWHCTGVSNGHPRLTVYTSYKQCTWLT